MCACVLGLTLLNYSAMAQSDSSHKDADRYEAATYFMLGFDYLSNYIYMGRKDTLALPYYTPYIGYHMSNGLYAKAMMSYTTAGNGRIDLVTLEAAYDHSFGDLATGAYADKYFYNKASNSVRSLCKAAVGVYAQWTNDYIEPLLLVEAVQFANSRDFVLSFKADHEFDAMKEKLTITPTFSYSVGQRHYYNEYLVKGLERLNNRPNVSAVIPALDRMAPLVYELNAECIYVADKWLFRLVPGYVVPLSPATITIFNKTFQEAISNTFYVELDICYRYAKHIN
jgi:hypothetical protein